MQTAPTEHPRFVVGPLGERLTLADLPAANTTRWVPRRKAQIVSAIKGGLLSFEEASVRYTLTSEELAEWTRWEGLFGMKGLRTGKLQYYKTAARHEQS
jgi:hypothetical protein